MTIDNRRLPSFANPPVVEVAASVQFARLDRVRTAHVGLFWNEVRGDLPKVEEHWPLEPTEERFDGPKPPKIRIQISAPDQPPSPRVWFLSEDETELVQVQSDRFTRNWRKVGDSSTYPRYEPRIRPRFVGDLKLFSDFIRRNELGEIRVNQCEITYVNHIAPGSGWSDFSEVGKVVPSLQVRHSDSFLSNVEDLEASWRYVIHDDAASPAGRLHVNVAPRYGADGHTRLLVATLTARVGVPSPDIEAVAERLDLCREWVVRGFASITSPEMHRVWRREDV